jgi:2-polyprenyl-6-methoxyphenol hydroxylase-like FAD-dependent oxidoreductase
MSQIRFHIGRICREETVEASWLIGCDGAHSTVRHQLGMEFHGSTLLSDWILADIHLNGVPGVPAINIFWHAQGMLAIFPLHGTRYRVIALPARPRRNHS